jgi:uncharacterized membrane protein
MPVQRYPILSKTFRLARRLASRLWVRVSLVASLAVLAVLTAELLRVFVPEAAVQMVGVEALRRLLDILSASMLAVTTFSLTVMVTLQRSAAQMFTPRAHLVLMKDRTTQNALATFIGAWIYALVATVILDLPYFGERGQVALFVTTVLLLVLIVVSTLRWIVHLQAAGSLIDTARRLEDEAAEALATRPELFARVFEGEPPDGIPIRAPETGYVQAIYEDRLQAIAEERGCDLWLLVRPGDFVQEGDPVAVAPSDRDDLSPEVCRQLRIGRVRTTEQDPEFGLLLLSEMASKALSAGINDQGTAIDVLGRLARVLRAWEEPEGEPACTRLRVPARDLDAMIGRVVDPIARDGEAVIEVQVALQDRLAGTVAHVPPPLAEAMRRACRRARDRALAALSTEQERARLARSAAWLRE